MRKAGDKTSSSLRLPPKTPSTQHHPSMTRKI
jgi:hypothetical protein